MERAEFEARLRDGLLPYRRCTDPDCPVRYAYVTPPSDHYHWDPTWSGDEQV